MQDAGLDHPITGITRSRDFVGIPPLRQAQGRDFRRGGWNGNL